MPFRTCHVSAVGNTAAMNMAGQILLDILISVFTDGARTLRLDSRVYAEYLIDTLEEAKKYIFEIAIMCSKSGRQPEAGYLWLRG